MPTTASRCVPATRTGRRPCRSRPHFPDAPTADPAASPFKRLTRPENSAPQPRGVPCSSIPARSTPATRRNIQKKCCRVRPTAAPCEKRSSFRHLRKFFARTRPGPTALPPIFRQPRFNASLGLCATFFFKSYRTARNCSFPQPTTRTRLASALPHGPVPRCRPTGAKFRAASCARPFPTMSR